jgi:energy-converting hydrogenase Eha subunit H
MRNLSKVRRLPLVSSAQLVFFKTCIISCKRLIKMLKCNLMLFGQALQNFQAHPKLSKPPLAMVVKDAIMLILILFVLKVNISMLSKLL